MKDAVSQSDPLDLATLLRAGLADPATAWSLGSFGAVAEFLRDEDEPAALRDGPVLEARTARGGLRVRPDPALRPVAYETATATGWSHAVALCLPADACAMSGRTVVTELGPDDGRFGDGRLGDGGADGGAIDPAGRGAVLFDLGLGVPQADVCVRTDAPEAIALLRAAAGRPLLAPGNPLWPALPRLSPDRVFICRFGRVEVRQPIPPPDGRSPEGPHTHVLPKLLAGKRTHAATAPIPDGWTPCMHLFPPHPAKDGQGTPIPFDLGRHAAFQAILDRYGDPVLVSLKRRIEEALRAGYMPDGGEPASRAGRMAARVALRQAAAVAAAIPGPSLHPSPG